MLKVMMVPRKKIQRCNAVGFGNEQRRHKPKNVAIEARVGKE
jgi:hypothetical protein